MICLTNTLKPRHSGDKPCGKATSKETVFVPKIEAGYQRTFGTMGHEYATPSIGYGYGIKLNADGNETKADEGSRFIPGISFGYRF